jgi:hypothetical protein
VAPYVTLEYYTVGRPSDAGGSWVQFDELDSVIVDLGEQATDQIGTAAPEYTWLVLGNPANADGTLTTIDTWFNSDATGLRVGTFFLVSGNTYQCRDSVTIGSVTAGSKQTFTVSLQVKVGDVLGFYMSGGSIERGVTPNVGLPFGTRYLSGEYIDPGDQVVNTLDAGGACSLYGYTIGPINRVLEIKHSWESLRHSATLTLQNSDSAFDAYDLKGKWFRIGLGMVCGSTPYVSYAPYLYCQGQSFYSEPKQDVYEVYGEGAWNKLIRHVCFNNNNPLQTDAQQGFYAFNQADLDSSLVNMTWRQIVDYILTFSGLDLGTDINTVDGRVDSWYPAFTIVPNETADQPILRLLFPINCVLIPRTDCMHLKVNASGDAVDYTYKLPTDALYHPFSGGQYRSLLYSPMKCVVTSNAAAVHLVSDTIDICTSVAATTKATFATRAREIKDKYNVHRASTTYHLLADNTNVMYMDLPHKVEDLSDTITQADAGTGDYEACCDLLIAIRESHNLHADGLYALDYHNVLDNVSLIINYLVHENPAKDIGDQITSDPATDLATAITLLNEEHLRYSGPGLICHQIFEGHAASDNVNTDDSEEATDALTAMMRANRLKSTFNPHLTQSGVHWVNDATNVITAADAYDSLVGVLFYDYDLSDYVDYTSQAKNPAVGDVKLSSELTQNAGYSLYCFSDRTCLIHFLISQAGAGIGITWKYWSDPFGLGGSFVSCTGVVDGTVGFTVSGQNSVAYNDPGENVWTSTTIKGLTGYWIKADDDNLAGSIAWGTTVQGTVNEASIITLANDIRTKMSSHWGWWDSAIATFANAAHNCYEYHRVLGPSPAAHVVADALNVGTSDVATDIATAILRANNIKSVENLHFLHPEVSVVAMANHEKSILNFHFIQSGVHVVNDVTNTIVADNATNLATSYVLIDAVFTGFNAHLGGDSYTTGEYAATGWTSDMGFYSWPPYNVTDWGILKSNADCTFVATSIVQKAGSDSESGAITPYIMNCLQELYDKVQVVDGRGNISGTGRIGGIYDSYIPQKKIYTSAIRLGGLLKTLPNDVSGITNIVSGVQQVQSTPNTVLPVADPHSKGAYWRNSTTNVIYQSQG